MEDTVSVSLAGRYRILEVERQPFLDTAREVARLTIPSLMPPQGHNNYTKLRAGHQSFGARALNTLASKLVLTLLPTNRPMHRTDIDEISIGKLAQEPGKKADIQDGLAKYDRALHTHVEASQLRHKTNEAMLQALAAGTVVLHMQDERKVRIHKLDSFVQSLDGTGALLELIIREQVSPDTLSQDIKDACKVVNGKSALSTKPEQIDVYTGVVLENGKYRVWQEINEVPVPDTEGFYKPDALPFLSLRLIAVDGESYGRSYCEAYLGDLISLENHSKSLNEGAILASKYIFFLGHQATVSPKQLQAAKNGAVLRGNAADVSVMRIDKANDMSISQQVASAIETRLSYAFLMQTAIQRQGERVTAEEIRVMARELEEGLGGMYSLLSQEFQLPVIRIYRSILEKQSKLPALPKDIVSVKIVTGLEALGRGQDIDQLQMFLQDCASLGNQAFGMLDMREAMIRLAVARGIDTTDLVKTREQLAQEQQQAMMQQMAQQAGPGVIQDAASRMMDGAAGGIPQA